MESGTGKTAQFLFFSLRDSETHCYGLSFVPPQIHLLKSYPPAPQNVTVFRERVFKELIKLK